jgi:hypothetical protein
MSRAASRRGAAFGFVGIAGFELALAAGAPWGHAAWGGAHADLSSAQRVGSLGAFFIWVGAELVILRRAQVWGEGPPGAFVRWATWALAATWVATAERFPFGSAARAGTGVRSPRSRRHGRHRPAILGAPRSAREARCGRIGMDAI